MLYAAQLPGMEYYFATLQQVAHELGACFKICPKSAILYRHEIQKQIVIATYFTKLDFLL